MNLTKSTLKIFLKKFETNVMLYSYRVESMNLENHLSGFYFKKTLTGVTITMS